MSLVQYDAIIVGAGLAGASAAFALHAAGHRVCLIDTHPVYPPDFRAEKLGQPQMAQFQRLGLGTFVRQATTPVDEIWVSRFGRLNTRLDMREYGVHYTQLVNAIRAKLPRDGVLMIGRVAEIETGPDRQTVAMADGRVVTGRLLVLATGLGDTLRRKVGIGKTVVSARHSLSFGFDMSASRDAFPFPSLTFYGDRFDARIAYLTLFPIGETMRANLFVYREPGDPWVKALRADPEAVLREALPSLARICPDLAVAGAVEMRPVDLVRAEAYRRDGVVLIGDSFLSPCPIPGTGIGKVLTDVERLCAVHLPEWLATPGMDRAKLAAFYDDPIKQAADAQCLSAGLYSRSLATDPGPAWTARRWRNFMGRHVLHGVRTAFGDPASTVPMVEPAPRLGRSGTAPGGATAGGAHGPSRR